MERAYAEYAAHQAAELLAIDSPTGFTEQAAVWVQNAFQTLGYDARRTVKGGVLIDLGGSDDADGLLLEAHADTLGGMVAEIKGTGRLRLTALGGMRPETARQRTFGSIPAAAGSLRAPSSCATPPSMSMTTMPGPSAATIPARWYWTRM